MPYKDKDKQREAQARWARNNRDTLNKHRNAHRRRNTERVREIKEASPCTDCNKSYPFYVMDFDHVTGEKLNNVGTMLGKNAAWVRIKAEIAKCELVCANCHRIRTYG